MDQQPQQRRRRRAPKGLTLIEIMVVIVILGVLSTLVGASVMGALSEAKVQTAVNQVRNFATALDHYKVRFGKYPTTAEGLQAMVKPPRGEPIMVEIPKDPWGNDYVYVSPGTQSRSGFDIRSLGPDGAEGNDDIASWELDKYK